MDKVRLDEVWRLHKELEDGRYKSALRRPFVG
jgi:hypothetical protein